ncbi:hypothetical protein AAZX31_01G118800 [Glycine max]
MNLCRLVLCSTQSLVCFSVFSVSVSIGWSRLSPLLATTIGTHNLTFTSSRRLSTLESHVDPPLASSDLFNTLLFFSHQVTGSPDSDITIGVKHIHLYITHVSLVENSTCFSY